MWLAKKSMSKKFIGVQTTALLRKYIRLLLSTNLIMIVMGIFTYRGSFHFWEDALSYLGATVNTQGEKNEISPFFFDTGLLICSMLSFKMARLWAQKHDWYSFRIKTFLMRLGGVGYLLMITPCNLFNPTHMLGSSFVFGSYWFFSVLLIQESKSKLGIWKVLLFHLLLQGTMLPYAYTYVILRTPIKQFYQKFAIAGLILTLDLITRLSFGQVTKTGIENPEVEISV
ncbi:MAG: hypothetical protein GXO83_03075 [Chlorobi bacterium]|nr:hypothetical protein [Chlorobiota bacterium]